MSDLLIKNVAVVITVDNSDSVLSNQDIFITNGEIERISAHEATSKANEVIDGVGLLLMPGLINSHTHLSMTLLRGIAEDVDLQGFLEKVWAEEARIMDPAGCKIGARLGSLEALLSGTTSAVDMYLHPKETHQAAVEVGLRHVTGPVFFDFDGPDHKTWPERLAEAKNWPQVVKQIGGPETPIFFMPHSTYTVSPEKLKEISEIAQAVGALIHTHVSENIAENEDVQNRFGASPSEILAQTNLLKNSLLGHSVHLTESDLDLIKENDASLAHCPGSNLKLASGAFDWDSRRSHQINVALGTDGCSSSNDLDMFNAMRLSANLAKLIKSNPSVISGAEVIRAATMGGAKAIGMQAKLGSVEVGKRADLIMLDLAAPHLTPLRDPIGLVVYAAGRSDVKHVIVDGEVVIKDRKPTKVDQVKVIASANEKARD
jgi:5-methylthioadenosine/S-adenosylhomocysteine deaminase